MLIGSYRSLAVVPFTYIGVAYMTSDLLATYLCYCTTRSLPFSSRQSVLIFLRRKVLLVVHHSVLILGYPLFVVSIPGGCVVLIEPLLVMLVRWVEEGTR